MDPPQEPGQNLFKIQVKFKIPPHNEPISLTAKYSLGYLNYFALALKSSSDLILLSDRTADWTLKVIPWFTDQTSRISALSFDEDGILYIGTSNGTIYELNVPAILNSTEVDIDLKEVFHFEELVITHILIWFKEASRTILCNGGNGKLVIITRNYPVLVTFTSQILSMELFVSNIGCNCLLVCLSSGTNLYTILNDLKIHDEIIRKQSIFKRAKENIISRFSSDEKHPPALKSIPIETFDRNIPVGQLKFTPLDQHSEGLLKRLDRSSQFIRHSGNKLDFFDSDFRQTLSIFIPAVEKLFDVQKIYYGVDSSWIRIMFVHNGALHHFATIPTPSHVISVESVGESTPHSVFVIAEDGIYCVTLVNSSLQTCVDLLLTATPSLDVVCAALSVNKSEVYSLCGDEKASQGAFAKAIIHYKLAGHSNTKIMSKFGARALIPAMLCFYELTEKERTKSMNLSERVSMSTIAVLARIEQFLRVGPGQKKKLVSILKLNEYYSTRQIAGWLCFEELLWAVPLIRKARKCDLDILNGIYENRDKISFNESALRVVTNTSWISIYTCAKPVFHWFRDLVKINLNQMDIKILQRLTSTLIPWRRELRMKLFNGMDMNEIIDFTAMTDGRVMPSEYIEFFICLILEILRRPAKCNLPQSITGLAGQAILPGNNLSTSTSHCSCLRNGKVYSWGENRSGRLGIHETPYALIQTPIQINIPSSLRLHIESMSSGHCHTLALTSFGTLLTWGSNTYGQLGVGKSTQWVGSPIPLELDVLFISISAGAYHSVALDELNRVWIWGWGVFGQLGYGGIESRFSPKILETEERIVQISAGHCHTGLITSDGQALTFGCSHFGQLGHGYPNVKVKVPKLIQGLSGLTNIECGTCSTTLYDHKRIFYTGLNPNSLKSLLTRSRHPKDGPAATEEKDHYSPIPIESSHLVGDITKIRSGTTHFVLLTSAGLVYTWGLGKSGQLGRPEDENKTLEAVEDYMGSDVAASADCTFIMDQNGKLFGSGFNSCGQLGPLENSESSSILTIRTKKRVVKVRQPANIYTRPREILGIPKVQHYDEPANVVEFYPPYANVDQNLLEWCLRSWVHFYKPSVVINECLFNGNLSGAVVVETLIDDHEAALKHDLDRGSSTTDSSSSIDNYYSFRKSPCLQQAKEFLSIVVTHWVKQDYPGKCLEVILEKYKTKEMSMSVKDKFGEGDESARWMAANLTPVFILSCFTDSRDHVGEQRKN